MKNSAGPVPARRRDAERRPGRHARAGAVLAVTLALGALGAAASAAAQTKALPLANTSDPAAPFYVDVTGLDFRTALPTRDPRNPGYPAASVLADGVLPTAGATGNYILGPSHPRAPEASPRAGVPQGRIESFVLTSFDSTIYRPGIARTERFFNASVNDAKTAPGDPSNLLVTTSHAAAWRRTVTVYIPSRLPRSPSPLLVVGDGDLTIGAGKPLFTVLDNLIAQGRIPPLVAVLIAPGGQDAQGSERGREYDAVSGTYAAFVDQEVLPEVERRLHVRLTRDPAGRATMGSSSAGVAAFTMAWFRPDLFRRVLAYSPTFVNQQWPHDPALPGGAWQYHSRYAGNAPPPLQTEGFLKVTPAPATADAPLVPSSPTKPIRLWFEVGDRDLFYPIPAMVDGMHDWVLANERMAAALAAKGYAYQFLFARNAGHVDQAVVAQTLPAALEWLWADYPRSRGRR